jgi:hypothetical protein
MPAWTDSPFVKVKGLTPGRPAYSAGSKNQSLSPGKFYVTQVSVLTNVVTLTVQQVAGNVPAVGDLITVRGLPLAAMNVSDTALTGVTINADTGIGTLTYAATTPDLAATPSGGQVVAAVPVVAEVSTPNQAYQAFAIPRTSLPGRQNGTRITLTVSHPSAPASIKYNLQVAINNVDAEYVSLGSDLTADGTTFFTTSAVYNFVRFKDTGSSGGTLPTVIAKLLM